MTSALPLPEALVEVDGLGLVLLTFCETAAVDRLRFVLPGAETADLPIAGILRRIGLARGEAGVGLLGALAGSPHLGGRAGTA